ncbi:MAG: hypothetical protein U0930_04865 [Pirellulales bacterium]
MAFATTNEFTDRYDFRLIGDLISDDETQVEDLTLTEVQGHTGTATVLNDASGEIVTNLIAGGRYTQAELESLTGYSKDHLTRICCDIAIGLLIQRRPKRLNQEIAESITDQARKHILAMRKGDNVFGIPEKVESGNLSIINQSPESIEALNLLPDRMGRFFPGQSQRGRR